MDKIKFLLQLPDDRRRVFLVASYRRGGAGIRQKALREKKE
jgi:hypothetical protein